MKNIKLFVLIVLVICLMMTGCGSKSSSNKWIFGCNNSNLNLLNSTTAKVMNDSVIWTIRDKYYLSTTYSDYLTGCGAGITTVDLNGIEINGDVKYEYDSTLLNVAPDTAGNFGANYRQIMGKTTPGTTTFTGTMNGETHVVTIYIYNTITLSNGTGINIADPHNVQSNNISNLDISYNYTTKTFHIPGGYEIISNVNSNTDGLSTIKVVPSGNFSNKDLTLINNSGSNIYVAKSIDGTKYFKFITFTPSSQLASGQITFLVSDTSGNFAY